MAFAMYQYVLALLSTFLFYTLYSRYRFNARYKLPPALPGALPLIGNTHQIPPLNQGLWGQRMARQHGELFTASIGGSTWVFLNSSRVVNDLMEKRSAIYSSRAPAPFASGLLSNDCRMLLMPYGERWRLLRRILHSVLNKQMMPTFAPFQDVESRHLLWDFLDSPQQWHLGTQRFANSVIMSVVFGKRMKLEDPDVRELFDTSNELILALQPGANLVDSLPVLAKILPKPLQWWRKRGERLHDKTVGVYKKQVQDLEKRMAEGNARDCFAVRFLKDPSTKDYGATQTYFALGSLMEAGSDTSRMTISQVMAAAATDKRWVVTAREALDRVCGPAGASAINMRLPNFDDRPELEYITATVKEAFRWRPFAEIGLPTMLIQDDEYEGYKFPKGTLFTWNAMAIALDEREYEQAERFWPERFLNGDLNNVMKGHWSFGPGRSSPSLTSHLSADAAFHIRTKSMLGL
jgi:cytochrome P450